MCICEYLCTQRLYNINKRQAGSMYVTHHVYLIWINVFAIYRHHSQLHTSVIQVIMPSIYDPSTAYIAHLHSSLFTSRSLLVVDFSLWNLKFSTWRFLIELFTRHDMFVFSCLCCDRGDIRWDWTEIMEMLDTDTVWMPGCGIGKKPLTVF